MVGDLIWMQRFTGEGDAPKQLDAILYEDFMALRRAREILDQRILRYAGGLPISGSPVRSVIIRPAVRQSSNRNWHRSCCISSITRRTIAAKPILS
jgi:uncharacterized damage-inducible protein DinB